MRHYLNMQRVSRAKVSRDRLNFDRKFSQGSAAGMVQEKLLQFGVAGVDACGAPLSAFAPRKHGLSRSERL